MTDETKCPSCGMAMDALDGYVSHRSNTCPLGFRTWTQYEIKIIGDALAAARADAEKRGYERAREQATQKFIELSEKHYVNEIIVLELRAMQPRPSEAGMDDKT